MSAVSDIYDAMVTRLTGLYATHSRLAHPYAPELDIEPSLKKGWGLKVLPARNDNREVGCKISATRQWSVVFTRKVYSKDMDATSQASTEKDLLEDARLLINDVQQNVYLSSVSFNPNVKYVSDNGIEFLFVDEKPFYKIEVLLEVQWWEQVN